MPRKKVPPQGLFLLPVVDFLDYRKFTKALTSNEKKQLSGLIEQEIVPLGFYLVDFVVRVEGGKSMVEIFVDSDTGITAEQCADISRAITPLLDASEHFRGSYYLTVSSPGLDRPLKFQRQYAKHKGRILRIRWQSGDGSNNSEGTLEELTDVSIVLRTSGKETVTIPFEAISEARVKPRW